MNFLKIALLLFILIFLEMPAKSEYYTIKPFNKEFEQEIEKCAQRREHNIQIKEFIIQILALTKPDQDTCLKIAELILSLQQANQLIIKSQKQLDDSSENNIVGRLQEVKKNLKKANKLHIEVLNDLEMLLTPFFIKQLPTIKA